MDEDGRVVFTLCPRLASIFLISAQRGTEEEEAACGIQPMMDVISCRWNIPASQRSLKVASINWLPPEAAPELNKMNLEGLGLEELILIDYTAASHAVVQCKSLWLYQ